MNREQFFGKLAALDEQRLKKALWNLYWRGSAATRERIEAEIDPDQHGRVKRPSKQPVDPHQVLSEVAEFATLARSGAYMAGDRRVSPRERTRWRLTFKRLVGDAQDGLRAQDATAAATALERLIDLACEARDYEYFHSEDPVESAGFVVSDAVALLWATLQAHHGFAGFAQRAAPPAHPLGTPPRLDTQRLRPGRRTGNLAGQRAGTDATGSGYVGRVH
jgi:uncharacterized protein YfiM (DUF2279 family)